MNNKIIAKKISALADEITADSDYVYDPTHQNRPHGGGTWYKTEKGWSTHKPLKDPHIDLEKQEKRDFGFTKEQKKLAENAKSSDYRERKDVARNPNTHPITLDDLSRDMDWEVRAAVAENTSTTPYALESLSQDKDWAVRYSVAKNPEAPDEVLQNFSKSGDERMRMGVAQNLNAPPEILKNLSKDKNSDVRKLVGCNFATDQSILRNLAQDKEKKVQERALKTLTLKRHPFSYVKNLADNGDYDAEEYLKYLEYQEKKNS